MDLEMHAWTEQALLTHGQFVRRLARTLVVDENEAEELAQETWLVALRQAPAHVERPRSWLASVLRGLVFYLAGANKFLRVTQASQRAVDQCHD